MLKSVLDLFRKKPPASAPAPSDRPAATVPASEPQSIGVRWLGKDDPRNPFAVDGYDCLSFVTTMVSTTSDERIANSFTALRASLGREHVGSLPQDAVEFEGGLAYPLAGDIADGALFKARQMEDKWDVYLYDGRLYFARSWTGALMYVARFVTSSDRLSIDRVWAAREQAADPQYALRQLDYLVKSHVLGRRLPHPLPAGLEADLQTIGLFSFGQYGRQCCLGTFEDTLRDDMLKPRPKSP